MFACARCSAARRRQCRARIVIIDITVPPASSPLMLPPNEMQRILRQQRGTPARPGDRVEGQAKRRPEGRYPGSDDAGVKGIRSGMRHRRRGAQVPPRRLQAGARSVCTGHLMGFARPFRISSRCGFGTHLGIGRFTLAGVREPDDGGEKNHKHNSLHTKAEDERICQLRRHPHGGQRHDQGGRGDESAGASGRVSQAESRLERGCRGGSAPPCVAFWRSWSSPRNSGSAAICISTSRVRVNSIRRPAGRTTLRAEHASWPLLIQLSRERLAREMQATEHDGTFWDVQCLRDFV